ncbi:MAG TPA: AAA family ATPase, partial [Polyangiaceae bacterium]|nr:AAA family ATPase [Polyangiaceae bacterium]
MISRLLLRFGRAPGGPVQSFDVTPITVFVGPNNSGKSLILNEINHLCQNGEHKGQTSLILDRFEFTPQDAAAAKSILDSIRRAPDPNEVFPPGQVLVGNAGHRALINEQGFVELLRSPGANMRALAQWFLSHCTLMLNGSRRINLAGQQPGGDLNAPPQNSLQVLFRDDARRLTLRRIVNDAFHLHLVIDPTNLGNLRVRLSSVAPRDHTQERGIDADAVAFHAAATLIDQFSDGVRAFVGIMIELIAGEPRIILIDEPEAFLHPALASKLGLEVARSTSQSDKRLFVSTHSPQFVMGCIQSGAPVNIVRLTYRNSIATARLLPSGDLLKLMRHPLLRSTGLLSGLFYEFVVVTESDADRAFYQEINERLLRFKPEWGIPNCLFLNAQNWQTAHQLVRPLRDLGIPTAAILDVDIVNTGGGAWTSLLSGAHVPSASHQSLGQLRSAVNQLFTSTAGNVKAAGVALLQGQDREAAENLCDQLDSYGIFLVRGGELETWLAKLGAARHGPPWLIDV